MKIHWQGMDFSAPAVWRRDAANSRELEWALGGAPDAIFVNLYAEKKAVPMIVVLTRMLAPRF